MSQVHEVSKEEGGKKPTVASSNLVLLANCQSVFTKADFSIRLEIKTDRDRESESFTSQLLTFCHSCRRTQCTGLHFSSS